MQSRSLHTETIVAAGTIAACRAVGFDNLQASVPGQKVLGVATMPATAGKMTGVDVIGTTVIHSGSAVSRGDDLVVDAEGRAITAPGDAGEVVFATALRPATGPDQPIEVLLRR